MKPLTPSQAKDIAGGALTRGPDGDYFEYECDPTNPGQPLDTELAPDTSK